MGVATGICHDWQIEWTTMKQSYFDGASHVLLVIAKIAAQLDLERLEQEARAGAVRRVFVNPRQLIVMQDFLDDMLVLMQVAKQLGEVYQEMIEDMPSELL